MEAEEAGKLKIGFDDVKKKNGFGGCPFLSMIAGQTHQTSTAFGQYQEWEVAAVRELPNGHGPCSSSASSSH
jgi:hypothetical protein